MNESQYDLTLRLDALQEEKRRLIAANKLPPLNNSLPGDPSQRLFEVERQITEVSSKLTGQFPKARS